MWEGERGTNTFEGVASFYDTYETSDGKFVAVGCVEPQFYTEFLERLGLTDPELPAQHDGNGWPEMKKRIADAFQSKTRAEWAAIFAESDACVSPVLSPWEAHEHPHNAARGAFVEVGGVLQPAPAPRFSRTENAPPAAVDDGGRDVAQTLAAWGFDEPTITRLQETAAVR
jgi:alpha-methylacyl-CoA racemase